MAYGVGPEKETPGDPNNILDENEEWMQGEDGEGYEREVLRVRERGERREERELSLPATP